MTTYIRRTIEMHPDFVALLERLRAHYNAKTQAEVMQRAVQLLAVAAEHKFFVEQNGGLRELLIRSTDEPE